MGDRVRLKQDAAGQWWLGYTRYQRLYWRQTGTTSRSEAEDMAAEVEASLVAEQRGKMAERPDWRPPGLVEPPPAPPPPEHAAPFNPPRVR